MDTGRGYEKGEAQPFWLSLLRDVFDVAEPESPIKFEVPVKLKHTSFIDAFLPDTKVIIEQKSLSEDITQNKAQSDGSILTPYEQAQRYGSSLPYSMRPRWIVVCNFAEFLIYDMETLAAPVKAIKQSAQRILDVRAKFPDATFADLYDEVTMPYELRQAHHANDRAVATAYGLENLLDDESAIAVELLKLYQHQAHLKKEK